MPTAFKIQNRNTLLFSTGGMDPKFNAKGKLWSSRGALSNHLALVKNRVYKDCDIIEIEVVHTITSQTPASNYLLLKDQRKKAREDREKKIHEAELERHERAKLAALKAKYPDPT